MMTEERQREWFEAVGDSDIKTVTKMIEEGFNVNCQDNIRWTALHYACQCGCIDIAKLLIKHGADVNIQDNYGCTPLYVTCDWGDIEIAKLLIDNRVDITVKEKGYNKTPLNKMKINHPQKYEALMEWIIEYHPEKALELMASESVQSKGVGL